jgi:hypothetical protein
MLKVDLVLVGELFGDKGIINLGYLLVLFWVCLPEDFCQVHDVIPTWSTKHILDSFGKIYVLGHSCPSV